MMLQVLIAIALCSTYCSAYDKPTPGNSSLQDDKTNWEEIFKTLNDSGMSRTDDSNLDIFERIFRANANERGTGIGRSDTDVFLFEADIVINKSELTGSGYPNATSNRKKRAVIRNTGRNLWGRTIYYILDRSLGGRARGAITSAIKEWRDTLPCIKWIEITGKSRTSSYMHFFVGGGCYSQVGRVSGGQKVSIGRGCEYHGIAVHEIGHAMGLWHEQSRPDRDKYVEIVWNNIIPATRFNFQKQPISRVNDLGVSYDYDSVMHYGATAFAKSSGLVTIRSLHGRRRLGQRTGLSAKDKKQVQLLYKCGTAATTPPATTPPPTTLPTACTSDRSSHRQWCIESKKLSLCDNGLFKSYMTQYCCNTCKPTPPPPTTTPTPPPPTTTPTPSGCQDKEQSCDYWSGKGYCKPGNRYYDFMQKNCCKTCGKRVTTVAPCFDVSLVCAKWKNSGYCNHSYVGWMKINCKKTCSFC